MTRPPLVLLAALFLMLSPPSGAQQAATDNPHGPDLKEPCASCHSATAWRPASVSKTWKHAPKVFPLEGAHAQTNCRACHVSLTFKDAPTKCAVCHKDVHQGELGPDCSLCHSPRNFIDRSVMVQRHQTTRFPLTGTHVMTDCLACHPPVAQGHMTFVGRQVQCAACHLPQYMATTNPPHQSNGFPVTCEGCHTTVQWAMGGFNHAATGFALTGAHATTACNLCHKNNQFTKLATDCYSCHSTDFTNPANSVNHVSVGFPTACETCHTTSTWAGASFNHATTGFALTGAHAAVACNQCHLNNQFTKLATDCYSCHTTDYNLSSNPVNHSAAGFAPAQCATCHTTTAWYPGAYTHPTTPFAITGAHVPLACNACHGDNVYHGKSGLCYSCHQKDYTNPANSVDHVAAAFPTTCETCHNTTSWAGATFNHDQSYFPIYSGHHQGVWNNNCATCHTTAGNYAAFSCLNGCHAKSTTDSHHSGVHGYVYDSQHCYSCHPRGSAG
ncbi:MAG TPA: hypothetical protein VMT93_07035 [Gemmatimonadaceae bacterium]|nr:hypothetical protein [Gemmatimonadaceae bacterium]